VGNAFLTGWSLPPHFFDFSADTKVIDSTLLVHDLITDGTLSKNWDSELTSWFQTTYSTVDEIMGFSMGAILALRLAQFIPFKKVTLLAPTLSFVSRPDHQSGINQRVLSRMIKALQNNSDKTLYDFDMNCGINCSIDRNYSPEILESGLIFLRDVLVPPLPLPGNPIVEIIHGESDQIIPLDSGVRVASLLNSTITKVTGGHSSVLK